MNFSYKENMIINFFNTITECQHEKVVADSEGAYCPDCGAYVENKWYLARCSCCNIKRVSYSKFNKVKPASKYCPNCGSKGFYLEEIKNINFIDVHFAVLKKEASSGIEPALRSQIWVDEKENTPLKFIGLIHR